MAHTDEPVRALAQALRMTGYETSILEFGTEEHSAATMLLEGCFPMHRWGRVNWSLVIDSECYEANELAGQHRCAEKLLRRWVQESDRVFATWTDGHSPILATAASGVLRHLGRILEVDSDVWVYAAGGEWCLEVYHEGQVCFGFSSKVSPIGREVSDT